MASTNHLCSMGRERWKPRVQRLVCIHRRTGSQRLSGWSLMGTCLLPPWSGGQRPAGCLHTFRDGTLTPELSKMAHYIAGLGTQFLKFLLPSCLGSILLSRWRTSFHSSDVRAGIVCLSLIPRAKCRA